MTLGFIAVFAAIVYKVSNLGERSGSVPAAGNTAVEAAIPMPLGARLADADLDGGRALLRLEGPGEAATLILMELPSGRVLGRYSLKQQ